MGKARLDRLVAFAQAVIVGVADLGLILPVVERIVMSDPGRQARKLTFGLRLAQFGHGLRA